MSPAGKHRFLLVAVPPLLTAPQVLCNSLQPSSGSRQGRSQPRPPQPGPPSLHCSSSPPVRLSPAAGVVGSVPAWLVTGLRWLCSVPAGCGHLPGVCPHELPSPTSAPSPRPLGPRTRGTRVEQWRNPNARLRNGANVSKPPFAPGSHGTDVSRGAASQAGTGQGGQP